MPSRQVYVASPLSSSESETRHPWHRHTAPSNHRSHYNIVIGFAVAGVVSALVATFLLVFILYRRFLSSKVKQSDFSTVKLQRFSYRQLKVATECFSNDNKLGQGGFGAVYKGILRNGEEVAVKKLDMTSLQGEREFQNELSVIGNVNSAHIVGLLGFCCDGKKRLLVYEYMHNRSLQEALFDESYPISLVWDKRFKIILDTAKALAFLHTKCDPGIIHGDIKPSNILLDRDFSSRIADFGLARLKTEANGPDVRSEDVEGQSMERSRIRSERIALEKERRQRKREVAEKTKQQQLEEPFKEEKVPAVASVLYKDSPSELGTSPNSEDPSIIFSSDQQDRNSSDCQEKQLVDNGAYGGTEQQNCFPSCNFLGLKDGLQDSIPEDTREGSLELVERGNTIVDLKLKCLGNSIQQKSLDLPRHIEGVKEVPLEQRSADMSKEEFGADEKTSQSDGCFEKMSLDSGKELQFVGVKPNDQKKGSFGRDWWWRQESSGELSVKEYVMEWMGNDCRRDKLRSSWTWREDNSTEDTSPNDMQKIEKRGSDQSRSSEWWGCAHDEPQLEQPRKEKKEKSKNRKCRQWWKEEYCAELSNKTRELKKGGEKRGCSASLERWRDDVSEIGSGKGRKTKLKQQKSRRLEWWKDDDLGQNKEWRFGERWRDRSSSRDWWSGDILSKGVSSTPSMRGTICYVAPEYGGGGILSGKSDVYSFGVLVLVIVSGRRPLQVTASPLMELERANLISWARHLAQSGNVLDLVDAALSGEYNKEEALLCITVALLCLQRLPAVRPNMSEVVKILSGETDVPTLPFDFSPSPPNGVPFKSHRHLSSDQVSADFPLLS